MILAMAVWLGGMAVCRAQDRPPHGGMGPGPGPDMEQLTQELGLNEDQQKQLQALFDELKPQRPADGQRPSADNREQMRKQMEERRAQMEEKLKAILTDEQFEKLQSLMQQRRPQRPPRQQRQTDDWGDDGWDDMD